METSWNKTAKKKKYPKLENNLVVDVAIIGGGLVGIQSAYFLAKAGEKVAVFEAKELGYDATQHTTAFLTCDIDTNLSDLIAASDKRTAKLVWDSGQNAIESIDSLIKEEFIDCEFMRCSTIIYANKDSEMKDLEKEKKAANSLGYNVSLAKKPLGFKNSGYMELPEQAKFHPLKYLYGVAQAAETWGAKIFENTEVKKVTDKKSYVLITTKNKSIRADYAIIATYNPLGNPKQTLFKKGMYTSYVLEIAIPHGIIPEALYLDTENPYHYFRIDAGQKNDRMIIGGEDHRSEIPIKAEKNYRALKEYLKALLGGRTYTIRRKWLGPILEPSDGLPLIGKINEREFVAAAFSGNGMTYSMVAAQLFYNTIMGKPNPYVKIYNPTRALPLKRLMRKGLDYTQEFFQGAVKNALN